MKILQRTTSIIGWASAAAGSALVVLESTGVIGSGWRTRSADLLAWLLGPPSSRWITALAGLGLAIIALVALAAQLVPTRRRVAALVIDRTVKGSTVVTAPTIYRRVGHELSAIEGVRSVTPQPHRRKLAFRIELTDTANASDVAEAARDAMQPDLWSSLGVPSRPVDLTFTYRRASKPVSRKELQ